MLELELKALVPDPDAVRDRLTAAGAAAGFRGVLEDRRFDRDGALAGCDEVLRVRTHRGDDGAVACVLAWKGPTRISPDGYKARDEIACPVGGEGTIEPLLAALGYSVVEAIDRFVECFTLDGAVARLEWYPRMDVLLEVEGPPAAIESTARATGLPRASFVADRLVEFAARYLARTGQNPILTLSGLPGSREAAGWPT